MTIWTRWFVRKSTSDVSLEIHGHPWARKSYAGQYSFLCRSPRASLVSVRPAPRKLSQTVEAFSVSLGLSMQSRRPFAVTGRA